MLKNSDLEVLHTAIKWLDDGDKVELVTLTRCWGSAPRPVGSLAAVRSDGTVVGSVSGGCIEKELSALLRDNVSTEIIRHQVSHDQALRFGLACGGNLELLFESFNNADDFKTIVQQLESRKRVSRTVNLKTGEATIALTDRDQTFVDNNEKVIKVFGPAWRLLLIGGGQLSRYVAEMAQALDYEVIVCEPRDHFSRAWPLPKIAIDPALPDDAVQASHCDARTAVLALTHDPNLDDLAILEAMNTDAFYIGALGSRGNNDKRRKRLKALGASDSQISRLHGPVGLAIGSRAPAEIAISILAELIQVRNKQG